jgi:hypothetical protein
MSAMRISVSLRLLISLEGVVNELAMVSRFRLTLTAAGDSCGIKLKRSREIPNFAIFDERLRELMSLLVRGVHEQISPQ